MIIVVGMVWFVFSHWPRSLYLPRNGGRNRVVGSMRETVGIVATASTTKSITIGTTIDSPHNINHNHR